MTLTLSKLLEIETRSLVAIILADSLRLEEMAKVGNGITT